MIVCIGNYKGYKVYQDGEIIGHNWYGEFFCKELKNGRYYKVKGSVCKSLETLKAFIRAIEDKKRMPFAHLFVDGKIHFDARQWTCTDPDEFQFCRVIDKNTFEYIQLENDTLKKKYQGCGKNLLKKINEKTTLRDWMEDVINVDDYTDEEKEEYLSPYGGILDGTNDEEVCRNQLIAECIFETDIVFN